MSFDIRSQIPIQISSLDFTSAFRHLIEYGFSMHSAGTESRFQEGKGREGKGNK